MLSRLAATIRRLSVARAKPIPRRARNALFVLSLIIFAALAMWSWRQLGEVAGGIDRSHLAMATAVGAVLVGIKAVQFALAAQVLEMRVTATESLQVAVFANAANLLPLPGSILVTVHSLSAAGTTYARATATTATLRLVWLALTGLYGGAAIAVAGAVGVGVGVTAAGAILLATSWYLLNSISADRPARLFGKALLVETAFVGVTALQLWLILGALRVDTAPQHAIALTTAGSVAAALSIFPGGLGLREVLAGVISVLVDLDASIGVLTSVVAQLVSFVVLAFAVIVVKILDTRGRGSQRTRTRSEAGFETDSSDSHQTAEKIGEPPGSRGA
jgi:hypothetical protein